MLQPMQPGMINPLAKPSWRGLSQGGNRIPVAEFIGQCTAWAVAPDNFGNQNVNLSFGNCQVLHSDTPWPYAEITLAIKISQSVNSGWGKLGETIARAFGVTMDILDIDQLMGQWVHMVRHDATVFGQDRNTGKDMTGVTWEMVGFVQTGVQVVPRYVAEYPHPVPGVNGAPANSNLAPAMPTPPLAVAPAVVPGMPVPTAPAIIPPVPQPIAPVAPIPDVPAAAVPVAQAMAPPVPQAVPVAPVATAVTPPVTAAVADDTLDARTRAKQLLHNKTAADFFSAAITDQTIRGDLGLVNAIAQSQFIPGLIASNEVQAQPDGTYLIIA